MFSFLFAVLQTKLNYEKQEETDDGNEQETYTHKEDDNRGDGENTAINKETETITNKSYGKKTNDAKRNEEEHNQILTAQRKS